MKTPRDILLARHQEANTRLDEIRKEVVTGFPPAKPKAENSFVQNLWRELVWPCRWTWAGLATAWLLLVAVNFSPAPGGQVSAVKAATSRSEVRMALREQRRVVDEIIQPGVVKSPVALPQRRNDQPRSQLPVAIG